MTGQRHDIAIAGAGLAGSLIALALRRARPDLSVLLLEAADEPGQGETWHWLAHQLPDGADLLLSTLRKTSWDSGYEVRFAGLTRRLPGTCHILTPHDLGAALRRELDARAIRCHARVAALEAGAVMLDSGERIAARTVIDCRGFAGGEALSGAWHHTLARHLRLPAPHGLPGPVTIDASLEQGGSLRFLSVLPLGVDELLIADHALLPTARPDRRLASRRIDAYSASRGWLDAALLGHEAGCRPVVAAGDFAAWQSSLAMPGVVLAGSRAGLFNPLTGQSIAAAAAIALRIAAEAELPGEQLAALIAGEARRHWTATAPGRRLAGLLLGSGAGLTALERLYAQDEALIRRFDCAALTRADRLRLACPAPGRGGRLRLATGAPLGDSAG
ncbi:lycopene beta-cyclase CrtY [Novosphingobium sp.]|uniref:lycopene beta-cyclase CrtY n=1 Tax=Novosphingobium sp. TaxID=1874826 RepID=UPI001ECFB73A|nr:lycopene beta-cyclase CrtY [Novosphingobium sp.]MBK6803068.1 lycopene beta-cyclase CrtY [Novosphingobium sp.]MBK9012083.1 lycopene beta-cyclase CrtY [Novosphingobium sp.]